MDKKLVHHFDYSWQGQHFCSVLTEAGIDGSLISVPREYSNIIAGGYSDPVDVYVDARNYEKAKGLLTEFFADQETELREGKQESSVQSSPETNYYKRVITFSLVGIFFLPVVGNLMAAVNLARLQKQRLSNGKIFFAFVIFFVCAVIALVEAYWILFKT